MECLESAGKFLVQWRPHKLTVRMKRHFGDFVRWQKARRGYGHKELASKLGCSQKTITNILAYPTPARLGDVYLSRLAFALGYRSEAEFLEAWKSGLPPLDANVLAVDDVKPPEGPSGRRGGKSPKHGQQHKQ